MDVELFEAIKQFPAGTKVKYRQCRKFKYGRNEEVVNEPWRNQHGDIIVQLLHQGACGVPIDRVSKINPL